MTDLQESNELDNLLSEKKIGFGRARDLFEEYAAICNLETHILRGQPLDIAMAEDSTEG
jgi:hypothetical protein